MSSQDHTTQHNDPDPQKSSEGEDEAEKLLVDLLQRCTKLVIELEAFETFLDQHKKANAIEIGHFKTSVKSEHRGLQKIKSTGQPASRTIHSLRSSNLPYNEAVWAETKKCKRLVALGKRFYWDGYESLGKGKRSGNIPNNTTSRKNERLKCSVLVDIIAEGGQEWIKVSTVTETRLGFEIAKKAWEAGFSDSDDEEREDGAVGGTGELHGSRGEDDDRVEILRLAEDLQKAANAVITTDGHPRVNFVLPRISKGSHRDVDRILDAIEATGATVVCGLTALGPNGPHVDQDINHYPSCRAGCREAPEDVDGQQSEELTRLTAAFHDLIPSTPELTSTLNLDCNLLFGIISDLCNIFPSSITPRAHPPAILQQISSERDDPVLPTYLFPTMEARQLVCVREAVEKMREIVVTIGTPTEKKRMAILLAEGEYAGMSASGLQKEFQKVCNYKVPAEWNLPVQIVDCRDIVAEALKNGVLPPAATKVAEQLTDINWSVFSYGWASGYMTLSNGRTVVKMIRNIVEEESMKGDLVAGPKIWICGTARSLLAKEKPR